MIKSLIAGILLGIAAVGLGLHLYPVVDQQRERSLISVTPNGGNTEVFWVNVPMDRIMIGAPLQSSPLPPGLRWPVDEQLAGIRAELFKIRNANDSVVGVASRIAASGDESGDVIEWVLHLPARGSVYITFEPQAIEGGYRVGEFRTGTREFRGLRGRATEQWIAGAPESEEKQTGRIELVTAFVSGEDES